MKKKRSNSSEREKFAEDLAAETLADFGRRREARLGYERQWQLNLDFAAGKQYRRIDNSGEVADEGKRFYWQARGVYNHVAVIIETRLAKLARVSPVPTVTPSSGDDDEITNARLAERLITSRFNKRDFKNAVRTVTEWSEHCGSGFYKVVWNAAGGAVVGRADGQEVHEGEVDVLAVSPFEIYPDDLAAEGLEEVGSLIQARAVPVQRIKDEYGVEVEGGDNEVLGGIMENSALLIEKYVRPSAAEPDGKLIVVGGGKLLYAGALPYINGENGTRGFPFVMQKTCPSAGSFFGRSVIERLIPVQRAYNAVKNRKHEFLNRLTMGVVAVEDGSMDVEDLENEGLPPGKLLVYRQGSKPPEIVSENALPPDFAGEEEKLLDEFVGVSGVSNVTSSRENARVTSGSALEILIEQDNTRLTAAAERIRTAYVEIAVQMLRLYREFTVGVRAVKTLDNDSIARVAYVDKNVLSSDDVRIANENELLYTENTRRSMLLEIYRSGILSDGEGKLRTSTRSRLLELLGYADLDGDKTLIKLHEEKALGENETLLERPLEVDEYDDHGLHIEEHTRYVLSENENLGEEVKARFAAHIRSHRKKIKEENING